MKEFTAKCQYYTRKTLSNMTVSKYNQANYEPRVVICKPNVTRM